DAIQLEAGTKLAGTGVSFSATVTDGRLDLNSLNGGFGFVNDTTGVLAGLGINTFFKGEGAGDISVNADIVKNLNLINAAAINGGGEGNSGDTITALEISKLATKKVSFKDPATGKVTEQTLLANYSSYVTKVGADTQTAKYNATLYGTMAMDLRNQQDSNSGVNLDEEMTNLVRFQNSYKAAAKLITTADEMLQTILGLKQ
ncbi:MAG: flagellar hook-associated protein FlgK, partial [Deltaproteobacteria bacterium]|nr:flagellar hook-associated protein FlgK [Deltaproteobacteria bacterium]